MIDVLGLDHRQASVGIRERFALDEPEIGCFVSQLRAREPFREVVVLSTCNRTEIYFSSPKPCGTRDLGALRRSLCAFKAVRDEAAELWYALRERQAVRHLFRVASGLESLVIGENQVLGQVKAAYRISAEGGHTGKVLNRLFHKAFEVGKAVRSETALNQGAVSVAAAAVELAGRVFSRLAEHPVLLVGAGETAELALQSLTQQGSGHLHVVNRTLARAAALAGRYGAEGFDFGRLDEQLEHCDVVILSTASRTPLLGREALGRVMQRRGNRGLFLIDLSVPRDVEPSARQLENLFVYDLDDLRQVVEHNTDRRKAEIGTAERIIEGHVQEFFDWLSTLDLTPTIARLRERFGAMSRSELDSLKNRLSEEAYQKVEEFGHYLEGKYLGLIIKNLRSLSRDGRQLQYIDLVNELFELRQGDPR